MGYYKNRGDLRTETRRYNAARRRASKMGTLDSSRLIRMETISEIERYNIASDADRLTAFNQAVQKWQNSVAAQLRAAISTRSMRIARELQPRAYTDRYGLIDRLGFSFPRHGIYIHKGAGRSQGGTIGSSRRNSSASMALKSAPALSAIPIPIHSMPLKAPATGRPTNGSTPLSVTVFPNSPTLLATISIP